MNGATLCRFEPKNSHALRDFDQATDGLGRPSGARGGEGGAVGQDQEDEDDIVMGGGQQELLNNKCPLTQINVSAPQCAS